MFLKEFFNVTSQGIEITAKQASHFAKKVAGDFNPIHDVGAKRFCVPGDLLFAVILEKYGLSQQMSFNFEGMVSEGVELLFPNESAPQMTIQDNRNKTYLNVCQQGEVSHSPQQIEAFIRSYVAFSALNFIHILIPMMEKQQVMISPTRPLVIYDSMSFHLSHFDFESIRLALINQQLTVNGKRGDAVLEFALFDGDKQIGTGRKTLVLSGLRELEPTALRALYDEYESRRLKGCEAFQSIA